MFHNEAKMALKNCNKIFLQLYGSNISQNVVWITILSRTKETKYKVNPYGSKVLLLLKSTAYFPVQEHLRAREYQLKNLSLPIISHTFLLRIFK